MLRWKLPGLFSNEVLQKEVREVGVGSDTSDETPMEISLSIMIQLYKSCHE